MQDGDSIFRQPLGEVMRREISADFLKKELTIPEFLKKDIPLGILDKEIHFRRKPEEPPDDSAAVEQTTCYSCRKETPATVATCLHCGAPLEAAYKQETQFEDAAPSDVLSDDDEPSTLIDMVEELF